MKNIELTEDHKSKLKEMCDKLFENNDVQYQFSNKFFPDYGLLEVYDGKEWGFIHWFEFCLTEIINELSWRNIKTDILADCEYEDFRIELITNIFKDKLTTEKFHIIDYLYKEFKKLK